MRKLSASLPALLLVASLQATFLRAADEPAAVPPATSPAVPDGYQLVWADDFSKDPDGLPDATKWIYEEGFIRNHESQYYTKARKENVRIENGQLIIEGRKEEYTPPGKTKPVAHYTSGALETATKGKWQYGRIEAKALLPAGKGVWPAIWTLGDNIQQVGWPKCGEIDIMELIGREPDVIHGTIHFFADGKHASNGDKTPLENTHTAFHIYAVEWTPERIDFYVDDKKYHSVETKIAVNDGSNPFQKPHYIILNLALGGDWGGEIDDSIFPQRMVLDYVRVYQKTPPKTEAAATIDAK